MFSFLSKKQNADDLDIPQLQSNKPRRRSAGGGDGSWIKEVVFPDIDRSLEVVSVIFTTFEGSSYDNLFRQVPQEIPEGRVALYYLKTSGIKKLHDLLSDFKKMPIKEAPVEEEEEEKKEEKEEEEKKKEEENEKTSTNTEEIEKKKQVKPPRLENVGTEQIVNEINEVDRDCVLFNYECCSGCDDHGFPTNSVIDFIELLMKRGHIAMFSDFAVKALIRKWEEKKLGPNPFVKLGECHSEITLKFDCAVLNESKIPQLEAVARLNSTGECGLHCLGGTVVTGINWNKVSKSKVYDLTILTYATKLDGVSPSYNASNLCEFKEFNGTVGHAILKYKVGGEIIISSGHWIELSKLDSDVSNLVSWGEQYGSKYKEELDYIQDESISLEKRSAKMEMMSKQFVQQMPAVRKKRKMKSKKSYY